MSITLEVLGRYIPVGTVDAMRIALTAAGCTDIDLHQDLDYSQAFWTSNTGSRQTAKADDNHGLLQKVLEKYYGR